MRHERQVELLERLIDAGPGYVGLHGPATMIGANLDAAVCDHLGELDKIGEPAVEPVWMVGDDHVDLPPANKIKELLVLGTVRARVRAQIIVDQGVLHTPALLLSEVPTALGLAADAGRLAEHVQRDPGVDRGAQTQPR